MKKLVVATLLSLAIFSSGATADPIEKARFTLSGKKGLTSCDGCRDGWKRAVQETFRHLWQQKPKKRSAKVITGHIVRVELHHPELEVLVTNRDPENEMCGNFEGLVAYDRSGLVKPLPVLLKTVDSWAEEVMADIAFNGSYFRFQSEGGVRATPPCGEMIGITMHDGYLEWPTEGDPDMLHENINAAGTLQSYTLLFNADRTAKIKYVENHEELANVSSAIGGSLLFQGAPAPDQIELPPGSPKPSRKVARIGVGVLADQQTIIVVKLEGDNARIDKTIVRGQPLRRLAVLLGHLGAVEAINLDGSGSAHIVVRDESLGASSRPADTEGARPIANHFGFRLTNAPVEWISYGTRQTPED